MKAGGRRPSGKNQQATITSRTMGLSKRSLTPRFPTVTEAIFVGLSSRCSRI